MIVSVYARKRLKSSFWKAFAPIKKFISYRRKSMKKVPMTVAYRRHSRGTWKRKLLLDVWEIAAKAEDKTRFLGFCTFFFFTFRCALSSERGQFPCNPHFRVEELFILIEAANLSRVAKRSQIFFSRFQMQRRTCTTLFTFLRFMTNFYCIEYLSKKSFLFDLVTWVNQPKMHIPTFSWPWKIRKQWRPIVLSSSAEKENAEKSLVLKYHFILNHLQVLIDFHWFSWYRNIK